MKNQFEKIRLSHLQILWNIVADTQVRHVSNIKRKYLENAVSFDETLSFLEYLGFLKNDSSQLTPSKHFSSTSYSIDDFKKLILPALFSVSGDVSEQLRTFLLNFETETSRISFKTTEIEKVKFSDIRSLLLELGFITISSDYITYTVNPSYVDLFVKQVSRRGLTPESLKRKQAENDHIGLLAEDEVVKFEKKRLADILNETNKIEHTSRSNVLAGYDIKSLENYLDDSSNRIDRYIEVKAVSEKDFKFFMSRNELESAKVFGERYYLYLVPVAEKNVFDLDKLVIINNPFKNVYLNEYEWKKEEESVSFLMDTRQ